MFIYILNIKKLMVVNTIGEKHFQYVMIVKNYNYVVSVMKQINLIIKWIEEKLN